MTPEEREADAILMSPFHAHAGSAYVVLKIDRGKFSS
jgi:hypothetical protein